MFQQPRAHRMEAGRYYVVHARWPNLNALSRWSLVLFGVSAFEKLCNWNLNFFVNFSTSIVHWQDSPETVSYTHLDVYKRQEQTNDREDYQVKATKMEEAKKKCDEEKQEQIIELQKLREKLEKLEHEREEHAKAADNKSELDDLMLLVTELDEKNNKYRAKLKDLGVELSSDDDDDDDDDEDDTESDE